MASSYPTEEINITIRVYKLLALRNACNSDFRCTLATVKTENPRRIKLLPTANRHPQAMRVTSRKTRGCALHTSDKLVAKSLDAALECSIVLRVPLRAVLTRHGVLAREGNVQDIILIVARIAVNRSPVASRRK